MLLTPNVDNDLDNGNDMMSRNMSDTEHASGILRILLRSELGPQPFNLLSILHSSSVMHNGRNIE